MEPFETDQRFNAFYDKTYDRTLAYVTAHCGNLSDVADLMQETYLAIYRVLRKGDLQVEREEAYAIATAKSKLADWYRQKQRDREHIQSMDRDLSEEEWLEGVAVSAPSPEDAVLLRVEVAEVRSQLRHRDVKTQKAFYLRYVFGLSYGQIAGLLDQNEATVRSNVYRVTQKLRERKQNHEGI